MINCFETYFDAYFAYFAPILKSRMQFENLVFVIMSTRENTRLIARAYFKLTQKCLMFEAVFGHINPLSVFLISQQMWHPSSKNLSDFQGQPLIVICLLFMQYHEL